MSYMASWDSNGGEVLLANRRVHIIDDLLGTVLLLAAGAFAISLELTRRQVCTVYQLAFALCASWALFIVGGLVDHHLSDGQLSLALYGSYLSSSLTMSYIYLPILATVLVSLAFALHLSTCSNCDCCCVVGSKYASTSSSSSHKLCFEGRIRSHVSLYVACFVSLFVTIGTRLNVRLRGSAINPMGGTIHWTMLRSPFYLSIIHVSTLVLIALKLFLQHADKRAFHDSAHFRSFSQPLSTLGGQNTTAQPAPATAVEDLMRPPPVKKASFVARQHAPTFHDNASPRRSLEEKSAVSRSPRSTSSLPAAPASLKSEMVPTKSSSSLLSLSPDSSSSRRAPLHNGPSSYSQQHQQLRHSENNGGDVSSLISSDSESDEDVLLPTFKSTGSNALMPPIHQHPQLGSKIHKSSTSHRPPSSGGRGSGYASSPPSSPVSTASSSSSSFSFSSASANARQRMRTSRPRSSSNVSSTSTNLLSGSSDSEDPAFDSSSYYSDRPSSASSSSVSYGLRRRAPAAAQILTISAPAAPWTSQDNEWIECFDPVSGSVYYYNQLTGESRWER